MTNEEALQEAQAQLDTAGHAMVDAAAAFALVSKRLGRIEDLLVQLLDEGIEL